MKNPKNLIKLQELRASYYQLSQSKESLLNLIMEAEVGEQVYNSNAIENSTLTLEDTEKILQQIDLDRYINERELFETKNLARVVNYINLKAKNQQINLEIILLLHKMLISNIRDEVAGRFRNKNEWVKVANHIAPDPKLIKNLLEEMLIEHYSNNHLSIIRRVAKLHLTFEYIHPFVDGNGRIGRVINNYILIREGYVPINIKFLDRQKYYQAFREFDTKKSTKIMEEIITSALILSYNKRLAYLNGLMIITLQEYGKRQKVSYSNLLNKANRQTIPAFMERGKWKIGI